MSEKLTLHAAALRLLAFGPRIEKASTRAEEDRLCDERDELLAFFREADAARTTPTKDTTNA